MLKVGGGGGGGGMVQMFQPWKGEGGGDTRSSGSAISPFCSPLPVINTWALHILSACTHFTMTNIQSHLLSVSKPSAFCNYFVLFLW